MTLRARLSLVFALVVLLPLVAGVVLVGVLVPRALTDQVDARLAAGRALVTDEVGSLCDRMSLAAEVVGRLAAAGAAGGAPGQAVSRGLASYAVFAPSAGGAEYRAGSLPGPLPRPGVSDLASCRVGGGSARVAGLIGNTVVVRDTRGATLGTAGAALPASAAIDGAVRGADVAVTLIVGGRPVASTLRAGDAGAVAAAVRSAVNEPVAVRGMWVTRASLPGGLLAAVSAPAPSLTGLYAILAALVVAGLLLAAVVARQLALATVGPLVQVADAAGRVAAGDLSTRITVRSPQEVARLAKAFNSMTEELRQSIEEIRAGHQVLRRTLEQFGETLSGSLDVRRILSAVLEAAMTATEAQSGVVYLCQGPDARLALRRGDGFSSLPPVASLPLPAAETEERMCVEMKSGGAVRAVLLLGDPRPGRFDDEARDAVRTFATQAGVAIENVTLHEEAQRLSATDELTGLANFRALQQVLGKEVERATRFDRPLALLMIDLDRFKDVNDSFGHQRGDAVLAEVARRLGACVREVDTVARYGGEEFAVVLPEADAAGAARTAERICRAVRATPVSSEDGEPVSVSVSVGAAVFPAHGPTAAALLRSADRALYAAKAAGRDQWRLEPLSRTAPAPADR